MSIDSNSACVLGVYTSPAPRPMRRRVALTIRFLTRSFAFFFPTVPKSLSFPSPRAALIGPWDKAHPSYPNPQYRRVNFTV